MILMKPTHNNIINDKNMHYERNARGNVIKITIKTMIINYFHDSLRQG